MKISGFSAHSCDYLKSGVMDLTPLVKTMTQCQNSFIRGAYSMTLARGPIQATALALLFVSTKAAAQVSIEPEAICWYRAHTEDSLCPKLSHLKLRLDLPWNERLSFKLAYDPGQVQKISWYDTYTLGVQNRPSRNSWLADYGLRFQGGKYWELTIEDWTAATLIPDASGLAFSRALQDSGWNQTVARFTYSGPENLVASIIYGLGEGERLREVDREPYLAALLRIPLFSAFALQLAHSGDRDSLPRDALWYLPNADRKEAAKGIRSERQSASLVLDGSLPNLRGLQASVGWQRNRISNSRKTDIPRPELPLALDPTEALPYAAGTSLNRDSSLYSISYAILAEYVLALQIASLRVKDEANDRNITVRGRTYGLGKIDVDGWSLLIESHEERYDRFYADYHFAPSVDERQKGIRIIWTRLNWAW